MIKLHNDYSWNVLKEMKKNSIDSIVTDPPYGLGFMGKSWDKVLPPLEVWEECYRVLKPGGFLVAMSASRTFHRLSVQVEDLGFIVHPMVGWIYGSGFPKATDLSKQFDKQAGAKRKVIGKKESGCFSLKEESRHTIGASIAKEVDITVPSTSLAKKWDGWKYGLQALKPALEPIGVFQKPPLSPMTKNVKKYGVGAMNIDECRVSTDGKDKERHLREWDRVQSKQKKEGMFEKLGEIDLNDYVKDYVKDGRHPANLIHDGCMAGENFRYFNATPFLYCPKPSKNERNKGLDFFDLKESNYGKNFSGSDKGTISNSKHPNQNSHPTVKPIKLMEWLIKLVTPPEGIVLDPFLGSGTTGIAAKQNRYSFIGIEKDKDYFKIAEGRISSILI